MIWVKKYYQKEKNTLKKCLTAVEDFAHLTKGQWATDDATNKLVNDLIHNYKIKLNDLTRCVKKREIYNYCWR